MTRVKQKVKELRNFSTLIGERKEWEAWARRETKEYPWG
jgi:hypothetical protein